MICCLPFLFKFLRKIFIGGSNEKRGPDSNGSIGRGEAGPSSGPKDPKPNNNDSSFFEDPDERRKRLKREYHNSLSKEKKSEIAKKGTERRKNQPDHIKERNREKERIRVNNKNNSRSEAEKERIKISRRVENLSSEKRDKKNEAMRLRWEKKKENVTVESQELSKQAQRINRYKRNAKKSNPDLTEQEINIIAWDNEGKHLAKKLAKEGLTPLDDN